MTTRRISLDPHHPTCTYPAGPDLEGRDPRRCGYCAALMRRDYADAGLDLGLSAARPGEDPLDYRYRRSDP